MSDALRERAEHLKELPLGWDSYRAAKINPEAVDKAVEVAQALAPLFPSYGDGALVSDSEGGVTVEFHSDGFDCECWIQRVDQ